MKLHIWLNIRSEFLKLSPKLLEIQREYNSSLPIQTFFPNRVYHGLYYNPFTPSLKTPKKTINNQTSIKSLGNSLKTLWRPPLKNFPTTSKKVFITFLGDHKVAGRYLRPGFSSCRNTLHFDHQPPWYAHIPGTIYLFKVNNRSTRTMREICSKLTKKTPEWHHWCSSGVFIVNFKQI